MYQKGCFDFDIFTELGQGKSLEIAGQANILGECESNFNDMGLQQALDNITAVIHVMNILFDNDYDINTKKIIIYGQSHGAYLAYLCNVLAPHLFSLIIDNSAWIVPSYFFGNRVVCYHVGDVAVRATYDYLTKRIVDDMQVIDLSYLYSKFESNCHIVSYHGDEDSLVSHLSKRDFLENLNHVSYHEIDKDRIDNVFKSNSHALDVDLLEMFRLSMKNLSFEFQKSTDIILERVEIQTDKYRYEVDYLNVVPYLSKYKL